MTIAEILVEKLNGLPPEKQQVLLAFAESLVQEVQAEKDVNRAEGSARLTADPIWGLGAEPIRLGITDAAENHDAYLYGAIE